MQKSITFISLDPSETLKAYAFEKLERLDKYVENAAKANVVLTVEKFRHIAEVSVSADGFMINAHEETADMYSAIDMSLDKLEKQIKKNKKKFKKRRSTASRSKPLLHGEQEMAIPPMEAMEAEAQPRIMGVRSIEYKPMDVDEAVMQLGLTNDNFLVFTNAETEEVNVLYRLRDGNYGLIRPSS